MWEYLKELKSQLGPIESIWLCLLAFALLIVVGALPEITRRSYMPSAMQGALILIAWAIIIGIWKMGASK